MPYETVTAPCEEMIKYKTTDVGFAGVGLRVVPIQERSLLLKSKVSPEEYPTEYLQACFEGIRERAQLGTMYGYSVEGVEVTIFWVEVHPKDSNSEAFKRAGSLAFRSAVRKKGILRED